jgi:hypothetical protein
MNELTVVDKGTDWQRLKSLVFDSVSPDHKARVQPGPGGVEKPASATGCERLFHNIV